MRSDRGDEVGPRVYSAGPYFDHVTTGLAWVDGVDGADEARERFDRWRDRIDGVKVHMEITEEELAALVRRAHAGGLTVTGHLDSVSARRAIDLGIDRLEHGIFALPELGVRDASKGMDVDYLRRLASIDFDDGVAAALLDRIVDDRIVLVPTTVLLESVLAGPLRLAPDAERYLGPEGRRRVHAVWERFARMRRSAAAACGGSEAWDILVADVLARQHELIRRVHDRGGRVVAGTDPVFVDILPGYGVHREAEHFVAAGMSCLAAIRACTLDPAEALGLADDLGSIEPGKRADMVVIDGDPVRDIRALGRTRMVFQGGRRFSPTDLRESSVGAIE